MTAPKTVQRLRAALEDGIAGRAPANIALMRALMDAASPAQVDAGLAELAGRPDLGGEARERLVALGHLWRAHPQAWALVREVLEAADHAAEPAATADATVALWAATFDRLAATSPDTGVALYTLGDPDLLARATAEIVERLEAWGLVGPTRDGIEIGCGNGRFVAALAPRLASMAGLDISAGMIERARQRCAGLANVRLDHTDGRDLAGFATSSADLVLAVDVYPYLVLGGPDLVAHHVAEAARVLRRNGSLVILNFSYRGDPALDRADVDRLAAGSGFRVRRVATGDFSLWDGATFHLQR